MAEEEEQEEDENKRIRSREQARGQKFQWKGVGVIDHKNLLTS